MGNQRAFFEYHCWESPESADAVLWLHTRQIVEIIRPLSSDECDIDEIGQMYLVRFSDGLEYSVFQDELLYYLYY